MAPKRCASRRSRGRHCLPAPDHYLRGHGVTLKAAGAHALLRDSQPASGSTMSLRRWPPWVGNVRVLPGAWRRVATLSPDREASRSKRSYQRGRRVTS